VGLNGGCCRTYVGEGNGVVDVIGVSVWAGIEEMSNGIKMDKSTNVKKKKKKRIMISSIT
jgi:hypothetical protein